jgi:hypothetical protein
MMNGCWKMGEMRWAWLQRGSLLALLFMGACAGQCGIGSDGITVNGELGNGEFVYSCVGLSDPACDTGGLPLAFPTCIVRGGRFRLSYTLRELSARSRSKLDAALRVEPGSTSYFAGTSEFEALRTGRSVMLAREDEQVLDFLHFNIAEATSMSFRDLSGSQISMLELSAGDVELVRVLPAVDLCVTPGGALPLDVSGGDPIIATATTEPALEIAGVGPGTTTFFVRLGEVEHELTVTVTVDSSAPRRKRTDGGDTDGGSDSSTSDEAEGSESSPGDTDSSDDTTGDAKDGLTEGGAA